MTNHLTDETDIRKALVNFSNSPEYIELSHFYKENTFFHILKIHRKELQHSAILAWALNPSEFHALEQFPLKKFLEVCALVRFYGQQGDPPYLPEHFFDNVILGDYDLYNVNIEVEKVIQKDSRVDIFVEATIQIPAGSPDKKFRLLIENKVWSKENDSQTLRYKQWIDDQTRDKKNEISLLVYLTPLPSTDLLELKAPECQCKEFLHINYQYLYDYFYKRLFESTPSLKAKSILDDYIRTLSIPAFDQENSLDKASIKTTSELIMAIGKKERELLRKFWENHKDLIMIVHNAMSSDPESDDEERSYHKEQYESYIKKTKDYSEYYLCYNGTIIENEPKFKKSEIGLRVARVLIKNGLSDEGFQMLRSDKSSSYELLIERDAIPSGKEKKYKQGDSDVLSFGGREYCASSNWGVDQVKKFDAFLKKNFPQISIVKLDSSSDPQWL